MTAFSHRRREALACLLKEEVFQVAAVILRRGGFAGMTMDRIAREVGVSRGTLYNYFADADEVLNFVDAQAFRPVSDAIERIAAGPLPPLAKLSAIATTLFDSLYQDHGLALALFCKREPGGKRAKHKLKIRNALLGTLQQIIVDGTAQRQLRDVSPALAAECFLGSVASVLDTMLYAGALRPADEIVLQLMDVLFEGLRPHAGPSTS